MRRSCLHRWFIFHLFVCCLAISDGLFAQTPRRHALVLTERGGLHEGFVVAALDWLHRYAADSTIDFTVINNTDSISTAFLSRFALFIQLNFPPYHWSDEAKAAFENYITAGRGGWIGFHHASLLGEFDGYPMWHWFSDFLGGIRFKNYIAARATGTVHVEDPDHPVMKNVASVFSLPDDEWYTYDKDPRDKVHVIATVDESSYQPPSAIRMGDHPVIWTNPSVRARNVYFQVGHHAHLFTSEAFTTMFANAIHWAGALP